MCALKLGDRGKRVERLQQKLKTTGYDPGEIDGLFGYKTLESVSFLRRDLHLPPTGEINRQVYSVLKMRKYCGGSYARAPGGMLERTFDPKIVTFGMLPSADFELSTLDNDRTGTKVLRLDNTSFLTTQLVKVRKYPFYLAFNNLKGQRRAQVLALGRKAEGFIYLPWQASLDMDQPIIEKDLPNKLKRLIADLYWKDLYLGIPLMAFEWVIEPEKSDEAVRYSDRSTISLQKGVLKEGYPKEVPYDETITYLRKRGRKGRRVYGDFMFQYQRKRTATIVKVISTAEIQRIIDLCNEFHLSGVVFWGATLGEDRLSNLKIPKQL
ncbi:MAG: peptidoglycan-binding domain-containing protein [Firmicutes bacterium]|nr:peptidoglycan-binding domain-containing protein [Bacillota bacterium]MDD4264179.1 peptidoglycan-binding domain-containing protein [Bacillota bacterium]MDD4693568.1 peptidoglycan-binding domain-containing protein [Bacillota bacterium]